MIKLENENKKLKANGRLAGVPQGDVRSTLLVNLTPIGCVIDEGCRRSPANLSSVLS